HLTDEERMFFVTLLLENILTWARKQSGTTSLRALLYFDEIYGFMPPVAKPPSKAPLMTLVKQARAFGLGLMMVTQNPVDIDYKGLTNIGTWFIGKLQAKRDKEKVLEGLKGTLSPKDMERGVDYENIIDRLKSRVFLMHNVHEDGPVIFNTRWVMSYLRGPLTRPQLKNLLKMNGKEVTVPKDVDVATPPVIEKWDTTSSLSSRPSLSPDIDQIFLPINVGRGSAMDTVYESVGQDTDIKGVYIHYAPHILGEAQVRFFDKKRDIDDLTEVAMMIGPGEKTDLVDWGKAEELSIGPDNILSEPELQAAGGNVLYSNVPDSVNDPREIKGLEKELSNWLYYNKRSLIKEHKGLEIFQKHDESERDFLVRLHQAARERRDKEVDKLKDSYEKKIDKLSQKLDDLELDLESDKAEYEARKREEMVGMGESALSFFMGRKRTSGISTIARKRRLTAKAGQDIKETTQDIEQVKNDLSKLESELETAVKDITKRWENVEEDITDLEIRPRKSDVDIRMMAIAWKPYWKMEYETRNGSAVTEVGAYK
nr:hypothetical protein [Candidatus Methanofastidiosa archaeon]